ncbi:hypothetical protein [Emticicia sp. BO119]|uniref:hypothetical protein n=1 Tax=Emticicia sp. BO119 TaxID=2757768 RepID=UPI0015F1108B|nr:hypothetical protein [Emticicia sp. BO119]MBA4849465.1 hypothetical protein [Emticicia sp. BO119]
MNQFKEFNIIAENSTFIGDKVKISKVLNRKIEVHTYKVEDSKHNPGKCLCLQIKMDGKDHIIFTGSTVLLATIQKVPKDKFPFETTIIEENKMFQFT